MKVGGRHAPSAARRLPQHGGVGEPFPKFYQLFRVLFFLPSKLSSEISFTYVFDAHMYMCMFVCALVHVEARREPQMLSSEHHPFFQDRVSHRPKAHQASGILLFLPPPCFVCSE